MAEVAAEFIKPNDRLTSFERLEIYNRMYWFRLIDCVRDDCPGLRAAARRTAVRPARAGLPGEIPVALLHAAQPLLAAGAVHPARSRA